LHAVDVVDDAVAAAWCLMLMVMLMGALDAVLMLMVVLMVVLD
jgi:hypothetical protein